MTRSATNTDHAAGARRLQTELGVVALVVLAFSSVWVVARADATPAPISLRLSPGGDNVIATGNVPTTEDRNALLFAIADSSPNGIVVSTVEVDSEAAAPGEPTITASELLSKLIGDDD